MEEPIVIILSCSHGYLWFQFLFYNSAVNFLIAISTSDRRTYLSKVVTHTSCFSLISLDWLHVKYRILFKISVITYKKVLNSSSLVYIKHVLALHVIGLLCSLWNTEYCSKSVWSHIKSYKLRQSRIYKTFPCYTCSGRDNICNLPLHI